MKRTYKEDSSKSSALGNRSLRLLSVIGSPNPGSWTSEVPLPIVLGSLFFFWLRMSAGGSRLWAPRNGDACVCRQMQTTRAQMLSITLAQQVVASESKKTTCKSQVNVISGEFYSFSTIVFLIISACLSLRPLLQLRRESRP